MVLTMTAGSTAVSWAGSDMSAIESSIKAALGSYEASQTTSDGDLMFFVYELLPDDMKDKEIEIYRDRFEAATTEKDGKILFYVAIDGTLIPDEDAAPLEARIPKLPKQEDLSSPQLDEDWSLAAKAMKKLKVSNSLTKAQLLSAAKAAIKNGSKCEWKEGFYKEDATADKEGKIQGYLQLSLITWSDSNMAGCSFGGSKQQPFTLAGPHMSNVLSFEDPTAPLTVGTIDEFIEYYLEHHKEARVDYVHDEPAVRALCKKGAVAFLMPPFAKSDLFKGVVMGGVLPRKTFSMGHAEEKRYYVECRKITE